MKATGSKAKRRITAIATVITTVVLAGAWIPAFAYRLDPDDNAGPVAPAAPAAATPETSGKGWITALAIAAGIALALFALTSLRRRVRPRVAEMGA